MNSEIFSLSENVSSIRNVTKQVGSEQRLPRPKAKALGDVQNTLHSRPPGFINPNTNSAVKAPNKSLVNGKPPFENFSSLKKASEKKTSVTPRQSAFTSLLSTPNYEMDLCEIHNHKLCEEDQKSYVDDFLEEYKFTEEQMNNLARSFRSFRNPVSFQLYEPCEDIEIPKVRKFEEKRFSISDIFSDAVVPEIPPIL